MGDIEKFFNDNFFKKVNSKHDADNMQIKRDFEEDRKEFMHGVPEAAYEPMVMPVDEDDDNNNNNNNNNNEEQHMNYKANDPFRAAVREGLLICKH